MNLPHSHNEYPMYLTTMKIGTFIEEFVPNRQVGIKLDGIVMNNLYDIRFLFFSQYEHNGYLGDKETREWISQRVFPKTRQNRDEILRDLGLSEYDQIEIFKKNFGACRKDPIWINFTGTMTFEDLYYDHDEIMTNTFWKYYDGFVPKTVQDVGIPLQAVFYNRTDRY